MTSKPPIDPVAAEKAALRRAALDRRDEIPAEHRAAAAAAIAARPLPVPVTAGTVVSGYMAIRSELDPAPLMRRFVENGTGLALPVVRGRGQPLAFRAWAPGVPLVTAGFGLLEPAPEAPEVVPDVLLVPLACFDRTGHRIGYGAGHYDTTLAALRAERPVVAIGIAFAAQEIARVPANGRDARLDLVLTEAEVIDCR
ncbi:5-formyltetrahydrofolate cyclo-ligase [Rhodoplanes sp. TEM]|uniref:5-formyltetrahydrofolate cyclo-ligase n=1 Tax=Rhodoplanes tepidamans TaxID=200616 RepID=A0ABT5JEM3_RHOTP|nr:MULTISPECIES: 5-formyltetrahydrofolate cyclo-ligase [Rhodoplanes]MDC7788067.1 5-formyltetrahydrofolate cyclo-ligase [Rhodoplanes tepidamans]MDC7987403.1 5-formyltetrahydrofolate cyclo-ligase [Rhodoplanes sp. TEM]MDQ0353944.1 5-formyltetrahydrofolate cyclo-ligase [Rhodoplanes tepidamans]